MEAIARPRLKDSAMNRYLRSICHKSPRTVSTYREILALLEHRVRTPLEAMTVDELLALIGEFDAGRSASSSNVARAALKGYLHFLGRNDDAGRISYFRHFWLPRCDLMQGQLDRVLEKARSNERALILTLYSTGARVGELCGKRFDGSRPIVSDLDWVRGRIRIVGKGGRPDCLVFFPRRAEALDALREYLAGKQAGHIFVNQWRARKLVRRAGARVGVRLHPHMLRHAGATSLIMQGVSTRVVQAWLRHSSLEMTERYTHVAKSDLIALAQTREWR